jgi:hypothetical protein
MASVLCFEVEWSRGMRELVFIARRRFQERKEIIWEGGFGRWFDRKKSDAGVKKKKVALTGGPAMSATAERKTRQRARASLLGQRPDSLGSAQGGETEGKESGPRAREKGERASWWAAGPKAKKRSKFLFFFLFKYFKEFSNDFESYFEFESNHSIQKFKCNSMSAQTCSYPYI